MKLIKSVEVAYFRSIHKQKIENLSNLTVFFGRNDSGKSNFLRALNLFFNDRTNPDQIFSFTRDFNTSRISEVNSSTDARKFIYIKIEFNTPDNWKSSLGKSFYVKRSWSVTRGTEATQTSSVKKTKTQFLTKFLNQIKFHYIPAIKDRTIFENLLSEVYQVIAADKEFSGSLANFTTELRSKTDIISKGLSDELGIDSFIAPPVDLTDLFRSLDFETRDSIGNPYSLTLQRGDGIQVRHIPQILSFISDQSSKNFHIWGFEEPENSLELVNADKEAKLLLKLSRNQNKQIFITSHSPAFFSLNHADVKRYYVSKSEIIRDINNSKCILVSNNDIPSELMGETPLLPVISSYLTEAIRKHEILEKSIIELQEEVNTVRKPILFLEGDSDALIFKKAWKIFTNNRAMPFELKSCAGTTKMKSLSQDGIVLKTVGNDREIFVLVDNDKEGRELAKNAGCAKTPKGGTWHQHNSNKSYWCLLKYTTHFESIMNNLKIPKESWPFTIENCFHQDIHQEAKSLGVIDFENLPHDELIKCDKSVKIVIPLISDDSYTYLRNPIADKKIQFAQWLCDLPEERDNVFTPFRSIIEGLVARLDEN
jgi:predicted ATPase